MPVQDAAAAGGAPDREPYAAGVPQRPRPTPDEAGALQDREPGLEPGPQARPVQDPATPVAGPLQAVPMGSAVTGHTLPVQDTPAGAAVTGHKLPVQDTPVGAAVPAREWAGKDAAGMVATPARRRRAGMGRSRPPCLCCGPGGPDVATDLGNPHRYGPEEGRERPPGPHVPGGEDPFAPPSGLSLLDFA
jgi:hypothetical protein